MKTVNMHEAKTHLSRLVEEAAAGVDIVIARGGKPLVRLVPVAAAAGPRALGALAGRVVEQKDAFAPDPDIDAAFYGGEVEPVRAQRIAEPNVDKKRKSPARKK